MARKHFVIHSCFHLTQLWRAGNSNCRGRLSEAAAQLSPLLGSVVETRTREVSLAGGDAAVRARHL